MKEKLSALRTRIEPLLDIALDELSDTFDNLKFNRFYIGRIIEIIALPLLLCISATYLWDFGVYIVENWGRATFVALVWLCAISFIIRKIAILTFDSHHADSSPSLGSAQALGLAREVSRTVAIAPLASDERLRTRALHEAGHVVAFETFDLDYDYVTILSSTDGRNGGYVISPDMENRATIAWKTMIILWSGHHAEKRFASNKDIFMGADNDVEKIENLALRLYRNRADLGFDYHSATDIEEHAYREAAELIDAHATSVITLADHLFDNPDTRVTKAQVHELLNPSNHVDVASEQSRRLSTNAR